MKFSIVRLTALIALSIIIGAGIAIVNHPGPEGISIADRYLSKENQAQIPKVQSQTQSTQNHTNVKNNTITTQSSPTPEPRKEEMRKAVDNYQEKLDNEYKHVYKALGEEKKDVEYLK